MCFFHDFNGFEKEEDKLFTLPPSPKWGREEEEEDFLTYRHRKSRGEEFWSFFSLQSRSELSAGGEQERNETKAFSRSSNLRERKKDISTSSKVVVLRGFELTTFICRIGVWGRPLQFLRFLYFPKCPSKFLYFQKYPWCFHSLSKKAPFLRGLLLEMVIKASKELWLSMDNNLQPWSKCIGNACQMMNNHVFSWL